MFFKLSNQTPNQRAADANIGHILQPNEWIQVAYGEPINMWVTREAGQITATKSNLTNRYAYSGSTYVFLPGAPTASNTVLISGSAERTDYAVQNVGSIPIGIAALDGSDDPVDAHVLQPRETKIVSAPSNPDHIWTATYLTGIDTGGGAVAVSQVEVRKGLTTREIGDTHAVEENARAIDYLESVTTDLTGVPAPTGWQNTAGDNSQGGIGFLSDNTVPTLVLARGIENDRGFANRWTGTDLSNNIGRYPVIVFPTSADVRDYRLRTESTEGIVSERPISSLSRLGSTRILGQAQWVYADTLYPLDGTYNVLELQVTGSSAHKGATTYAGQLSGRIVAEENLRTNVVQALCIKRPIATSSTFPSTTTHGIGDHIGLSWTLSSGVSDRGYDTSTQSIIFPLNPQGILLGFVLEFRNGNNVQSTTFVPTWDGYDQNNSPTGIAIGARVYYNAIHHCQASIGATGTGRLLVLRYELTSAFPANTTMRVEEVVIGL